MRAQRFPESLDARVSRIAAVRHGVFTRAEAMREGATRRAIEGRLRNGRWERLQRGVYRLAGTPATWSQSLVAACLTAGARAAASHRAAGVVWGVPGVPPDVLEISMPRDRRVHPEGAIVHRVNDLSGDDVVVKEGIPVTTPARTLIDLASVLQPDRLEEALDDALHRRLLTLGWLRWRIEALRRPGRPGIGLIDAIVESRSGEEPAESVLETRLLRVILRAGLPRPVQQYEVWDSGRFVARVDFAYPDVRLAIEADGHRWHAADRGRWRRDLARRNALLAAGWRVLHVTWTDVAQQPEAVVRMIAEALRGNRIV